MVPAAFGDHQNMFQEGIRFPPVKIYESDQEVEAIFKILISNVRTPKHSYGDMKAMIGSLYLAERRIDELVDAVRRRHVRAVLRGHQERLGAADARRDRRPGRTASTRPRACSRTTASCPTGPWKIKGTLVIRGDELIVDFTGSDPQCFGPANQTFGTTASAAYNAVLHMRLERDPLQPRLLPGDLGDRAARELRQRELPRLVRRRQLGHAPDDGGHAAEGVLADLGAQLGRRRRHLRLHRLRRRGPAHARAVRASPPGGRRLGRPRRRRR